MGRSPVVCQAKAGVDGGTIGSCAAESLRAGEQTGNCEEGRQDCHRGNMGTERARKCSKGMTEGEARQE